MATRMQQRRGTEAQWTSANPVLAAGEIGFEIDTNKFKIGDGINQWEDLSYFLDTSDLQGSFEDYVPLTQKGAANGVAELDANGQVPVSQLGNLIEDAPALLDTLEEIAAALGDDPDFASKVVPIVKKNTAGWSSDSSVIPLGTIAYDTNLLRFKVGNGVNNFADLEFVMAQSHVDTSVGDAVQSAVDGILNDTEFTGTVILPSGTSIGSVTDVQIGYLAGVTSGIQGQFTALQGELDDVETSVSTLTESKADLASPTFTGTVTLPTSTSVGNVSSDELGYLNGVTSSIQTQLDDKADSATVSTTFAPLSGPTFTGTVVLPSTTSIGSVDSVELGHLNGVTSGIQTQLDSKAPTDNPTFTGTVAGVTKAHVGLGNVDNTADADKPVSIAQAEAIATARSEAISEATSQVNAVIASAPDALNTLDELAAALGDDANFATTVTNNLATKAPLANPTFTGAVTVSSSGIVFTDGTQTKQGVPSITPIAQQTASYTLSSLNERDTIIEVNSASATTITIPTDATLNYPIGTTLDILQTNTGQVTVAGAGVVTVNATPGLKLRTRWSSATLLKRAANSWVVFGDLTA